MNSPTDNGPILFVGLGRVGTPIARRLIAAGFPLRVFDNDATKVAAFEPQHRADGTKSGTDSDIGRVILCLPDPSSAADLVRAWLRGGPSPGSVIVDLGTMRPALAQALAAEAGQVGAHYLDAPLSGGQRGAQTGDIVVMVSGDEAAMARMRPVIETIGSTVRYLGSSGRASLLKSINQFMYISYNLIFADGLRLADQLGFGADDALDCLSNGAPRHPLIDDRLQAHGAQVFEIQRCVKDLQCFTPAPGFESEALALFDIVLMRLKGAVDAGHGSDDILSLSGTWP